MKRWLMETFMKIYYYFVKLTTLSDNYVYDRWMTYNSSPLMTEPSYKFWQDLSADWSTDDNEIYYYDLNGENIDTINEIARNIPDNVSNVVLHTKYYKSRMTYYKAERADGEYAWPPVNKTRSGMSFNPIVLDAWCGTQEEPKKFNIFCVIVEHVLLLQSIAFANMSTFLAFVSNVIPCSLQHQFFSIMDSSNVVLQIISLI